jgi:integral membrane protein (TIGR01906 family)
VIGPPDFDATVNGQPVLNERERGHMRDVRGVFTRFTVVALLAAAIVVVGVLTRRWTAIRNGAIAVAVIVPIVGVVAVLAFEPAFELFHELFFPAGSYTFDPSTDRLVQLFPFSFWSETTVALGVAITVLAVVVALIANWMGGAIGGPRTSGPTAVPVEVAR